MAAKLQHICFFCFFTLFVILGYSVVICDRCGYENPDGTEICSHCNEKLPLKVEEKKNTLAHCFDVFEEDGTLKYLAEKTVEEELNKGKEFFDLGKIFLAYFFYRNAFALDQLTDPSLNPSRSRKIMNAIQTCTLYQNISQRKCPLCGGSGKRTISARLLTGEIVTRQADGLLCSRCNGAGIVQVRSIPSDILISRAEAEKEYRNIQQARKWIPVGGAWIPSNLDGKLKVKQICVLKRCTATGCKFCGGIGRITCDACDGIGEQKCPNSKCQFGKVSVYKKGELTKDIFKYEEICQTCNGKGLVICTKCKGEGSIICSSCNGTGERNICSKCDGQGFIMCKQCGGTGKYRERICNSCRGEGIVVCSYCNGDGREK